MVCGNSTAVCGWAEIMQGKLISASFVMYDAAFANWTVAILFIVYQFILILKTKNLNISWVTGIFFISLYALSVYVKTISLQVIFVILVFELAGILYLLIWK